MVVVEPEGSATLDPRDPLGLMKGDGRQRHESWRQRLFVQLKRYGRLSDVDRNEIAQEAIESVFFRFRDPKEGCAGFDSAKDPMAYLTRVACNLANRLLDSDRDRQALTADGLVPEQAVPDAEPFQERNPALWEGPDDAVWDAVLDAVRKLPARKAKVAEMTLKGHTPNEIADELEISRSTVDNSLDQARRQIRRSSGVRDVLRQGHLRDDHE